MADKVVEKTERYFTVNTPESVGDSDLQISGVLRIF
jgi:hypothetical protein